METQNLSLQTRFVQNTLVSQNDVSNNIEWQIAATKYAEYMKNIGLACIFICTYNSHSGLGVWCCDIKHNAMVGCFTRQKG